MENGIFEMIQDSFGKAKNNPETCSALGLAYIGDAIFDLIIRTIILDQKNERVNVLHKRTSSLVKASSQAELIKILLDEDILSEKEVTIYKRGRNAKSASSAKNSSINDYRMATGFEALMGYLYFTDNMERAIELCKISLYKSKCFAKIDMG